MSITVAPQDLMPTGTSSKPLPNTIVAVSKKPQKSHRLLIALIAFAILGLACAIFTKLLEDKGFQTAAGRTPVDGTTIFAVFFVGALAIERLLEPISQWLVPKDDEKERAREKESAAKSKVDAAKGKADGSVEAETARQAIEQAAQAKADLAEKAWTRSVAHWIVASVVGMYAAAAFHLYFLGTVGIAQASRWEEILATGLIIGAGTKPLHDLTDLISAKKETAETS